MARLGDICYLITDGSHNPPAGVVSSDYKMLSSKNIDDDEITFDDPRYLSEEDFIMEDKRTNVSEGDLLMTIVGTVGRVAVVPKSMDRFCLQRSVAVLKPKRDIISSRFLMYQLQSMRTFIEQESRGVAQKGIYLKQVSNLSIMVPTIKKQQVIVDILDKLTSLISLRKQQLAKLDELVKARFVEMFGDPLSRSTYWPNKSITDVCLLICGGGTPSKSHPEYFTGNIPWVSPKDMKSLSIEDSIDHITEDAVKNSTTNLIPAKSVLMVIRSGILKHSLPVAINTVPVTINQDIKAFVPNTDITPEYLMYYFLAIETDILAGVRGVTADNIDFKSFLKRSICVPPIALQKNFTNFVEQTKYTRLTARQSLDKLEVMKKALMQEYFG